MKRQKANKAKGVSGPRREEPNEGLPRQEWHFEQVSTLVGAGRKGLVDGDFAATKFHGPSSACALPNGSMIVADTLNNCLRLVSLPHGKTVVLPTKPFLKPTAPTLVAPGKVVLVCDSGHHKIRLLELDRTDDGRRIVRDSVICGSGLVGSADGPGLTATFRQPSGLCILPDGSFLVADTGNSAIRQVVAGPGGVGLIVRTILGCGAEGYRDGLGASAALCRPTALTFDNQSGAVLVADSGNHCIRALIPPASWSVSTASTGSAANHQWGLVTLTGYRNATSGFRKNAGHVDGPAAGSLFKSPTGILYSGSGSVLVADTGNNCIRCLTTLHSVPAEALQQHNTPPPPSQRGPTDPAGRSRRDSKASHDIESNGRSERQTKQEGVASRKLPRFDADLLITRGDQQIALLGSASDILERYKALSSMEQELSKKIRSLQQRVSRSRNHLGTGRSVLPTEASIP